MDELKLFMVLLGCKPQGRHTEQHDIFFGIGHALRDLIPEMKAFWPEAQGQLHIDSWREVSRVGDYRINVLPKTARMNDKQLFFLNLGGYKKNEFEEYHYKLLTVCSDISMAIRSAKDTAFYKHTGFPQAESHIDDKYGVDVDDIYPVEDILPASARAAYTLHASVGNGQPEDQLQIGYFKLNKI